MLATEPHPLEEQQVLLAAEHPPSPSCLICKLTSLINFLIGSVILCILEPHPGLHDCNVSVVLWQLMPTHAWLSLSCLPWSLCPSLSSPVNLPALGTVPVESIVAPGSGRSFVPICTVELACLADGYALPSDLAPLAWSIHADLTHLQPAVFVPTHWMVMFSVLPLGLWILLAKVV